jgi:CarD family transcriptional regulator
MKSSQAKARSVQAKSAPKPAAAKAGAAKAARPAGKPAKPAAKKAETVKQAAARTPAARQPEKPAGKQAPKAAGLRGPAPATKAAKPAAAQPAQATKATAKPVPAAKPAPPPPAPSVPASAAPPPAAPKPEAARPAAPRPLPVRPQPAPQPAAPSEPPPQFAVGDHVVYPTHGVGKVTGVVTEEIAGHRLTLIVIEFEENRMVLRVPVAKARSAGLRKLSTRKAIDAALATLKGRARIKRTMWSRRAQEYEAKINSGDPVAIAEVVRDLHRNAGQPDQSFSERQIYEQAMDRLAAELAAIDGVDKPTAQAKLATVLKAA